MDIKTAITEVKDPTCRERDCRYHTLFRWQTSLVGLDPDRVEILSVDVRWRVKGAADRYPGLDTQVSRADVPPVRPIRYAPGPVGAIFVHAWLRNDIEGAWCDPDAPMLVPAAPVCITEIRSAAHPCHCGVFALRLRQQEAPAEKP